MKTTDGLPSKASPLLLYSALCTEKEKNGYQSIITVIHASSKKFQSIELDKSYWDRVTACNAAMLPKTSDAI